MKVQSKVSIFSMAFIIASATGFATEANAGLFKRSDAKYLRDKKKKLKTTREQLEENGADRGTDYVARKSGKLLKTQIQIDARRASMDAAAATAEAALNATSSDSGSTTSSSSSSSSSSTEIDLSQSPLFVDRVNGRCPTGYAEMSDGTCGNTYFRHRGPCADEGKDNGVQGKGDLGQGKGDLGQGEDKLDCTGKFLNVAENKCEDIPDCSLSDSPSTYNPTTNKCDPKPDPVCKSGTKLVNHKCVPDEHKHVDPVTPVRTKDWCEAHGFDFYVGKDGKGHCRSKTKKEETKKEEVKKETKKSECTVKDPCADKTAEIERLKQEKAEKDRQAQLERDRLQAEKDKAAAEAAKNKSDLEEAMNKLAEIKAQKDSANRIHVEGDFKNKETVSKKKGFLGLNKLFGRKRLVTGTFSGDISEDKALDLIEGNYLTANNRKKNLETTSEVGKYEAEYNEKYGVQKSETGGSAN